MKPLSLSALLSLAACVSVQGTPLPGVEERRYFSPEAVQVLFSEDEV